MSAPLVADGEYKIIHATYSSQAAELLHGVPLGSIAGFREGVNPPRPGQFWTVRNVGDNQVVLESAAVPGNYANARAHVRGGTLSGSPNPTIWTLERVGSDQFRIVTDDGGFLWVLLGTQNAATVLLAPSYLRSDITLWKFKRV